jgi:hypothetical protein
VNALFRKLTLDQLDADSRAWVARQFGGKPDELRMTILLYRPTGQVDFIFHEQRRPPKNVIRELAARNLLAIPAMGTVQ